LITIGLIKSGGNDALKLVEETSTIQPAQYVPGSQQYQVYQTPRYYNQNASGLSPQPQPSQPNPPTEVTCPNCKYRIAVLIRSLPASVKCPQCGTKGIIK
jgi:DNA-directed RNA polymerase subunit RPC12/RpoP